VCEKKERPDAAFEIWETIWRERGWDSHVPDEAIMPGLQLVAVYERERLDEAMKVWKAIWQEPIRDGHIRDKASMLEVQLAEVQEKHKRVKGALENLEASWQKLIWHCNVSHRGIQLGLQLVTVLQELRRLEDALEIWKIVWRMKTLYRSTCITAIKLALQLVPILRKNGRINGVMEIWEDLAAVHEMERLGDVGKKWDNWDTVWRSWRGDIPHRATESDLISSRVYEFLDEVEKMWDTIYQDLTWGHSISDHATKLGLELADRLGRHGQQLSSMQIWDQMAEG
jgi:hypothetical protein